MPESVVIAGSRHRRQRERPGAPDRIDTWPPQWRALTTAWVRRGPRCKWETLLAAAGGTAFETAHDLLEALLAGGWIRLDEAWREGRWQPLWIEFVALGELRAALGLPDTITQQTAVADLLSALLANTAARAFHPAAVEAAALRPALARARLELLTALAHWQHAETLPAQATRRDFAHFARGDTKALTSAEWDWLDAQVDLVACGINDHAPLLCIAAPLRLQLPRGTLDLDAAPDFIGLPPATLDQASAAEGDLAHWTLVENRTSFERVARQREPNSGVLWLPGFAPSWWQSAIARLLHLAPAPARIACDPDPAGIEIALGAAALWRAAGLDWQSWRMSPADLASLAHRKPLSDHDRERLAALLLYPMPDTLRELASALAQGGEKGEQEGYL